MLGRKKKLNMSQSLPESHRKILLHVAERGPQNKYRIEKETKLNHATVHKAVKNLSHMKLLQGKKVGKARTGRAKIEYKPTFLGLLYAIELSDIRRNLNKIIEKWRHLEPLILAKLDQIKQKVGDKPFEDFMEAVILYAARQVSKGEDPIKDFRERAIIWWLDWLGGIHYLMYLPKEKLELEKKYGQTVEQTLEKWITVLREDPQLKKLFLKQLDEELTWCRRRLEWDDSLKQKLS